MNYLQIRLVCGKALTQQFGVNDTLAAVRLYVKQLDESYDAPITFRTNFPRKEFSESDMGCSLAKLS